MSDHIPEGFRPRSFKFSLRLFDFCEDLASKPGMRLRIAKAKLLGKHSECEWLLDEADQFVAMLTVSVRKLQAETKKPPKPARTPTEIRKIEMLGSTSSAGNCPDAEN